MNEMSFEIFGVPEVPSPPARVQSPGDKASRVASSDLDQLGNLCFVLKRDTRDFLIKYQDLRAASKEQERSVHRSGCDVTAEHGAPAPCSAVTRRGLSTAALLIIERVSRQWWELGTGSA